MLSVDDQKSKLGKLVEVCLLHDYKVVHKRKLEGVLVTLVDRDITDLFDTSREVKV